MGLGNHSAAMTRGSPIPSSDGGRLRTVTVACAPRESETKKMVEFAGVGAVGAEPGRPPRRDNTTAQAHAPRALQINAKQSVPQLPVCHCHCHCHSDRRQELPQYSAPQLAHCTHIVTRACVSFALPHAVHLCWRARSRAASVTSSITLL